MLQDVPGQVIARDGKVVVVVTGDYSEEDAARAAAAVNDILVEQPRIELVVDLSGIDGFTRGAREVWQSYFRTYSKAVHTLTIVGGTPLARMASAAVCLYAGIRMRSAKDLGEVFPDDARRVP